MPTKLTPDEYIARCISKHGNKYDYTPTKYTSATSKIKYICPIHGVMEQLPNDHLSTTGCKKCSYEDRVKSKIDYHYSQFINKCEKIHNLYYKYPYPDDYKSNKSKIRIICPVHGEFSQIASNHIQGSACPKCSWKISSDKRTYTLNEFKMKGNIVHDFKYTYFDDYKKSQIPVKINCPLHGVFYQKPYSHLSGQGCPKCGHIKHADNKKNNFNWLHKCVELHGNKYDYSDIEYNGIHNKYPIYCDNKSHGKFYQSMHSHLKGHGCPKCSNGVSKIEDFIERILIKHNVKFVKNDRTILGGLEIDFLLPDLSIGIECDGLWWHSENNGKTKNYHLDKTLLAQSNGIRLIHIFEDEFLTKPSIISNRLRYILKQVKFKIPARKCEVRVLNNKEYKRKFLNKYHIQGNDKSTVDLGLFYKNRLISIMTFSNLRKSLGSNSKIGYYELSRFCSINNFHIVGGAGKLLKFFESQFSPLKIISYSDNRWNTGTVYENIGFKFSHNTSPNYWYFKNECHRYHRFKFIKSELPKLLITFDNNLSEWENMKSNGYYRIWDCGSKCYEKTY